MTKLWFCLQTYFLFCLFWVTFFCLYVEFYKRFSLHLEAFEWMRESRENRKNLMKN